jgi:hypothetical protein
MGCRYVIEIGRGWYCLAMAGLPTINNCTRVAFSWHVGTGGPTATNVMHFGTASTDTAALRTALDTNVSTNMWVGVSSGATIFQLAITPLNGTAATDLYSVAGTKWTGAGSNPDYVPAVAAVVSFKTAKRGRRFRGRVFLPFLCESSINNGSLAAAPIINQTAWDTFRTAMSSASFPLMVASYGHSLHKTKTSGGGFTMTPTSWTPEANNVTAAQVETLLGTMRPRQSRLR